ncbi:hypothetical protein CDD81_1398 [Ophiocordyceps australis]|uniref:Uncharacterized protein n=1 Tax=Ophiocordyceps australis TaxID=1399860 RepID=A0A2C5XFD9_9HYPO|nr:hypothetical protein CDD81_1398 [Ophiocordyceps australis]
MLASAVLETRGVYLPQLPILSILRSTNSSPYGLYKPLVAGPKDRGLLLYGTLILFTILTSLASNLISTILLSDFGNVDIKPPLKQETLAFGIPLDKPPSYTYGFSNLDYWLSRPHELPRFAEFASEPSYIDGVQDTGLSFRAPLPFTTSTEREKLKTFEGLTPILDSRVICMRPNFLEVELDTTGPTFNAIWDNLEPSQSLAKNQPGFIGPISCGTDHALVGSEMNMCSGMGNSLVPNDDNNLIKGDNLSRQTGLFYKDSYEIHAGLEALVMWNVTWPSGIVIQPGFKFANFTSSSHGIWTTWEAPFAQATKLLVSATLCYQKDVTPLMYKAKMVAKRRYKEQPPQFDTQLGNFSTDGAINLYCTHCSQSSRQNTGRLDLVLPANWSEAEILPFIPGTKSRASAFPDSKLTAYPKKLAFAQDEKVDLFYLNLFSDIFNHTGNLALALQSLYTVAFLASYYRIYPIFNVSQNASAQSWEPHNIPTRWSGFASIMVLLAIHILVLVFTIALFVGRTRESFLSDAWPIIAQVSTIDAAREVLHPDWRDDEVISRLKSQQLHKITYRIRRRHGLLQNEDEVSIET